jgi:membrane protease YdiL (CAAX protease family)
MLTSTQRLFLFMAGFEVGLGVVAVFVGWLTQIDPRAYIPKAHETRQLLSDTGMGVIATLPMLVAMFLLDMLPIRSMRELVDRTKTIVIPMMRQLSWPQIAVVAVAAGVGEEMLFRGWLQTSIAGQPTLASLAKPETMAAIVAGAIAFGMAHYITPAYFLVATGFGIYFGVLFCWSESLWVPIVAHALYDFVAICWLLYEDQAKQT